MILGRSVYNIFSTKFRYLNEKGIHRFRDLWEKIPSIKAYKNMNLT